MKNLKIWKMARDLRDARRVNAVLCLMAIGLCVLLVGTTGCATLSRTFHPKSDEMVEFEHALAATHGAPYEGNIPKLAALFAGLKAKDAGLLEKNDLGKLAEVFEICYGMPIPIDVYLWPSPNGLRVHLKRECKHNLRGGGLAFDSREIGVNINELRFSEDPDAGLTREELATRYAGVFSYGIEPSTEPPMRPYVPQEFRTNITTLIAVDTVAETSLYVTIGRTADEKHGYRVAYSAIITRQDALDRGLGKFGRLVEEYAGNGDDIVTPWEVERFGSNAPFYIAIAHGLVAHSDFATLAKSGVRVNDVNRFAVRVASLWGTIGEDTIIVR